MSTFVVQGKQRLVGSYPVQGNKNAALPLIAAGLLSERAVLDRVPDILDVRNLLRIVDSLGATVTRQGESLVIERPRTFEPRLDEEMVHQLRGSVLLLGVLLPEIGQLEAPLPGGCPIGRRSLETHWRVFEAAGFDVSEQNGRVRIRRSRQIEHPRVYLPEASVTATENALLLFARTGGTVENPAREPHVLSLIEFLQKLGVEVETHPLHYVIRKGVSSLGREIKFTIPPDYIDAGTAAFAAAVTHGCLRLESLRRDDFIGIHSTLEAFGLRVSWEDDAAVVDFEGTELRNPEKITAAPWPGFPTDLTSLAIVAATQAAGECLVHDWLYESRMFFVDKLVRMGARITLCDPHRVLVCGPTVLRGIRLESPDIRAGMALLVAGLCAEGVTIIEHAEVVERGYENVVSRFRGIGGQIRKLENDKVESPG